MNHLLLVVVGGGMGAGTRYLLGTYVSRLYSGLFPIGTFLVNLTGSFLIGMLMTAFVYRTKIDPAWRLFLVTGFLGGYTTFSSFEWETLAAIKGGVPLIALSNVLLSVVLGFVGVWAGSLLTRGGRLR